MTFAMKAYEPPHPLHIGLFRTDAVMFVTDAVAHQIQQLDRSSRRNAVFHSIKCHARMLPSYKNQEGGK